MSTGMTSAISQMDPTTKQEIWLFQEIGRSPAGPANNGQKVYRRLQYNLVRYDGDPTEYIEPHNAGSDFWNVLDGSGDPIDPRVKGVGAVVEMRYFGARPFEVFAYNDLDVAGNLGQLP